MAFTSHPLSFRIYRPGSRHYIQSVGEELTTGVKHTYLGPVGSGLSLQKGPSDAIGSTDVTFSGIIAGSEIRVFVGAIEIAGVESCSTDQILTWPYYTAGNPNNIVTIRIVSLAYKLLEFTYTTLRKSEQAIPIQQSPDPWYKNPA